MPVVEVRMLDIWRMESDVLDHVLLKKIRNEDFQMKRGLTDHGGEAPGPVLRLHGAGFVRRCDGGQVAADAYEGVDGHS